MATHAPNLECRMYESRYPEVDMAVMIQVKNIADMGAYVSLLEYNNIEGMILFSELSRCQIRSVSSLIKVGRTEPVMVLRVDKDKGYIDLSKRRVSEEDIQTCEERYNKSKLVHSIMRHVAETLSIDLEVFNKKFRWVNYALVDQDLWKHARLCNYVDTFFISHVSNSSWEEGGFCNNDIGELYVNIGWPLYRKYGHAFEAFKIVVTDPDSVLDTLTREVKELGPDGQEVKRVVPAVSEEVKDALVKNIRRRMTTQALKIRADIEMKCLQFDGVLHIKDAMRKADAVGNDDCPVKIKLVVPALYVLTTQTLEKEKGLAILNKAIVVCSEAIEQHKGKLVVKEAPRSVSERDDKLAEHMAKLRQDNEEVSSDEGSEEEVDTCMGEVDLENNHPTIWKIVKSSINQIQNNGKREIERTDYCEQRLLKRYRKKEGTKAKANGQSKGADREVKRAPKRDSRRVIEIAAQWLFLVSLVSVFHSTAGEAFDVRSHLSTVSSYNVGSNVVTDAFVPSRLLDDCVPVHLNLVARHGTRSPTKKRIRELDSLAVHMEKLIKDVEEQNLSLKQMPVWMRGWKSPWEGKLRGGELISKGEEELYNLGLRVRERFPDLFNDEYHPDVYVIKASQVPRASASAVAFGMGLFNGKGTLGQGNNRAFAVTSESRASDVLLRFHDCCANYKDFRKKRAPAVDKLKEPILEEITRALVKRFGMDFTRQDTSSLWFLCKQEASLLDITDQACGLFTSDEIALLEWTDDLEAFILKGYGNSLNYRMGMPLLQDVLQAMEEAISASKGKLPSRSYEKARLRFAHAETIVPFSCLLGLFLEGSEFQQILKEQPLDLPPKPPQKRNWRVSSVAPFGGNNMLVLYNCPSNSSSPYFVQVLHNEKPISVPGCGGASFCPFEDFKENIVAPHLKHDYHTICNVKPEEAVQERLPSEEFPSSPALLN